MTTRLSRYCDGIMEAAWLAAVILVPAFFNIYSSRIFEPDKIAILRSLALLVLAAWVVKLIDQGAVRVEHLRSGASWLRHIIKLPLIAPVLGIALLYLISTIFSITPSVSFWGSYQRLQGTYTTLSYIVIFSAIVSNMRNRAQLERLITTVIIASLPIALYGVLQKYKIDPVPWGGDTSRRIASNMGNSIFVAAYLIMVFPLTVGRIVLSFSAILKEETNLPIQMARATSYVFIAALQVIALYMSGSRGPALGWMASSFFLFLLLSLHWRRRWITIMTVGLAVALGVFLVVFNIEGGPLEGLRQSPAIGRFGLLLDAESNSALVRRYIWEGAADLVAPHDPLEFPDGNKDRFNFLRLIIGYGPESMYVAYNPFYIPELAQVEKRNASPDRSHNETWDSLVITGVLGIILYIAMFISVFYYGLKWIGLITSNRQKWLFFALSIGAGVIGAVGLSMWRGVEYFGVGMPFGILIGLIVYITLVAIFFTYEPPRNAGDALRSITLIVLISGIVAHFVEINFGIAIAVTRTYFWVFSALLLVSGHIFPALGQYEDVNVSAGSTSGNPEKESQRIRQISTRKKRKAGRSVTSPLTLRTIIPEGSIISGLTIGIVLTTLGFDYISNSQGIKSTLELIWTAFTRLPNRNYALSYGILALLITVWILISIIMASEPHYQRNNVGWWKYLGWTTIIAAAAGIIFYLWHAGTLAAMARSTASDLAGVIRQVERYEGLLTHFYVYVFICILLMAIFLPEVNVARVPPWTSAGVVAAFLALITVTSLTAYTNLRVIQADIAFKLADPFTRTNQWPVAISIYNRANELAPNEDYYYLFLGRAYLEHAKTLTDATEREKLIGQAAKDLVKAQALNPLNTDHTANLARLYSLWASYETAPENKLQKGQESADYFSRALILSPNNARLWDEYALVYLNILQQPEQAYERLERALEIDDSYHWTYALLAEYYNRNSRLLPDPQEQTNALKTAASYYEEAIALPTPGEPQAKYGYALAMGGVYVQLGQAADAIDAYQQALIYAPQGADGWRIEEAITGLFAQEGDLSNALVHAQLALDLAPDAQKDRLRNLIAQLQQRQSPP